MSKQLLNPLIPLGKPTVFIWYRRVLQILSSHFSFLFFLTTAFFFTSINVSAQSVGDYRSNATSMNWNAASSWQRWNGSTWVSNPSQGYPGQNTGTGAVTIQNGHSVVLNVSPSQNIGSLAIGSGSSGSLVFGNNNSNRSLSVSGNVTINNGGSLTTVGNGGNNLDVAGNLINNGTLDFNTGSSSADITFNGSDNQQLSGSGSTTDLNTVNIDNAGTTGHNIVEFVPATLTASSGFLSLTKGIFKISGSYSLSNTFFSTANPTIASDEGFWLNNPNVTVTGQNGDTQLSGLLRITAGTYNVGVSADWWLQYSSGASLIVEGGALNVSGALFGSTGSSVLSYSQSGGTVTICTAGNTYSVPSFGIQASSSDFTMSGGLLVIQKPSSSYDDYINYSSTSLVTGGTVQFGDPASPTSSLFYMKSTPQFYNMVVYSTNTPTLRLFTPTTFVNVIIGGVLDAATNNTDITVKGNWTNNGSFAPGTANVTFNSTTDAQTIGGTSNTAFYNLTNSNTNVTGLSLLTSASVSNVLSLSSSSNGKLNIGSNNLTIASTGNISGANSSRYIVTQPTTSTNGRLRQNGLSASAKVFPVGTASLYLPATITPNTAGSDFSISVFRSTTTNGIPGGPAFGSRSGQVDAVWQIDRTSGSANAHIRLDWYTDAVEGAGFTSLANSSIGIWRYSGTNWLLIPSPTVFSNNNSTNYASTASSAVSNFGTAGTGYPYIIGNITILPSAIKMFTAASTGSGNQLIWEVENAVQYKNFELQESSDGTHFNYLYSVTPGQEIRYSYLDAGIFVEKKYYQLKLTDYNGSITYSQIVAVGGKKETKLGLLQNPVSSQLRFSHPEAVNAAYIIADISGRVVVKGMIPRNAVISLVNVSVLANGTYVLQYVDGAETFSQVFLKQ